MSDANSLIQIKGLRDGLLVTMSGAPWEELQTAFLAQIEARQSFFRGARVALDVGEQVFHVNELSTLRDTLSERGVVLWAVLSESPTTEKTAQLLGLATRISKPRPQETARPVVEESKDQNALWLGRTLRSGTRVEYHGHVVVFGDVNPGAEIAAGGNILVWGRLRGAVHAGAAGDQTAVVCALDLAPNQLRIADQIAVLPKRKGAARPEKVSLRDGRFQADPWQADSQEKVTL